VVFGGLQFGAALIAAAAVFVPDPDFAPAVGAGFNELSTAAGGSAEADVIGNFLFLQPFVHDAADRTHARRDCWDCCVMGRARGSGSSALPLRSCSGGRTFELQGFFECLSEGSGGGVAIGGTFGECFEADGFECRGDAGIQ
jgi:hypothetical protein